MLTCMLIFFLLTDHFGFTFFRFLVIFCSFCKNAHSKIECFLDLTIIYEQVLILDFIFNSFNMEIRINIITKVFKLKANKIRLFIYWLCGDRANLKQVKDGGRYQEDIQNSREKLIPKCHNHEDDEKIKTVQF